MRGILCAVTFFLCSVWLFPCEQARSEDASDADVQTALKAQQAAWSRVQTFEYKVVSNDRVTEEFKRGLGYTEADRDTMKREFSFFFSGSNFGWTTETTLANGMRERKTRGSVYDGTLTIHFLGEAFIAATASTARFMADTPVAEYNPLTDAFSFLTAGKWEYDIAPVVTIEDLQSASLWADAAKRVSSVQEEVVNSKSLLRIDFRLCGERHMAVTFSEELGYAPVKWKVFGRSGKLVSETSVSESKEVSVPGRGKIVVPKRLEVRTYVEFQPPVLANIRELECSDFALNTEVGDDAFVMDSSVAVAIYDRDHDKWVSVPK